MKEAKENKGQAFSYQRPELTEELKAFYDRLDAKNLAPLCHSVFIQLKPAKPSLSALSA